jgi:hypothetical protein
MDQGVIGELEADELTLKIEHLAAVVAEIEDEKRRRAEQAARSANR